MTFRIRILDSRVLLLQTGPLGIFAITLFCEALEAKKKPI